MYGHGKFGGVKLGAKEREEEPGRFRRPRKISYLLRHPDFDERHVGGVNACALAPACGGGGGGGTNGTQLYTAGRDGTVRAWSLDALARDSSNSKRKGGPSGSGSGSNASSECVEAWEGHSSWVNDVAHLRTGDGNFLLSASSDSSVKVWSIDSPSANDSHRCVASLTRHRDYVMKLATGDAGCARFASAGLGECDNLFLWDAQRATAVVDFGRSSGVSGGESTDLVVDLEGQKESAYALAIDDAGNTLVSGCTGNVLRVWDGRTGARICKLRGHSGNVRCAALSGDGRLCLTGSSDHTLRLWDLGQQRCVQTVHQVHHCSVWSVAMDASWHVCYSGGADGGVYATDLAHRRSALLFEEEKGVLSLTLDSHDSSAGDGVWACTMGCGIRRWRCDVDWRDDEHAFTPGHRGGSISGHRFGSHKDSPMSVSPKLTPGRAGSARMSNAWGGKNASRAGADPIHGTPTATIESTPPIVEHVQTSDRTRILAADADGAVSLWDVIKCERVRCFERGVSLADAAKEVNPRVSVPSWFTVDTRSGSIAISLMPSGAFQAEAYAIDLGIAEANDELKVNYGVQCVHMLLRDWKVRRVRAIACENGRAPDSSDDDLDLDSNDFDVNSLTPCGDARVWRLPPRPPSVVCEQPEGEGGAVLMPVGEMVGSAEEQDALPEWIVDVVAERHRVPDSAKASFHLSPHETQPDAPKLSQGRVTAPRVLGVRKVVNYVVQKLGLDANGSRAPEDLVDILCGGEVCDPAMSLATVKEFLWRKGTDVELVYRFKDGVDYGGSGGGDVETA